MVHHITPLGLIPPLLDVGDDDGADGVGVRLLWSKPPHSTAMGSHQGRPNPNPMSAKLHRFATKIAVRDSFALGLEQFESKKLAKVRTTLQKEKYFKNIVHFVLCNSMQSPIT